MRFISTLIVLAIALAGLFLALWFMTFAFQGMWTAVSLLFQ